MLSDRWLLYIPALVFLFALSIVLNIHYLDSTFSVTFQSFPSPILQGVLGWLDIFTKPTAVGSLRYSIDIIPGMTFFVVLAGIVPSIVFPYLRKFRVTSFNAVPFHKDILFGTLGTVFGITIVLSLVDIIYGVFVGTQPHYYSYVLPVLVGFSMYYSLGLFLGREKVEKIIEKKLDTLRGKRVLKGRVVVQEQKA